MRFPFCLLPLPHGGWRGQEALRMAPTPVDARPHDFRSQTGRLVWEVDIRGLLFPATSVLDGAMRKAS